MNQREIELYVEIFGKITAKNKFGMPTRKTFANVSA